MNILALDTSSDACSAALLTASGERYVEYQLAPRAHTRLILPMVETVLQQGGMKLADVDALAFGRGPGAFTGVRIATGIVQGLALSVDKPVIPVSTLAALAQQLYAEQAAEQVLVAVDARMSEVYWGAYSLQDGYMQLEGEEWVVGPADTPLVSATGWSACGTGWAVYADDLRPRFEGVVSEPVADLLPSAEYIAELAQYAYQQGAAVDAALAQPVYLRNKVAQTIKERALNQ